MNSKLVLLLLLCVSIGLYAQKVEFLHDQVIDFGNVNKGTVIHGEIKFKNIGNAVLELESIKPACGCTAITPEQMTYAPKESTTIPFTVETRNFSGVIRKNITIRFKNSDPQAHIIVVQAKIVTDLSTSPRFINFRDVSMNPDTTYTEFLEIENESPDEIEIKRIVSTNSSVHVFPENITIPSGKSHLIRLELTPAKPGRQNGQIMIESNHATQPEMSVPVFINIKSQS